MIRQLISRTDASMHDLLWYFGMAVVMTFLTVLLLLELAGWYFLTKVSTGPKPKHLIVIQGGYMTSMLRDIPMFLSFCRECRRRVATNPSVHFLIYASGCNEDNLFGLMRTNDGVDSGGKRLAAAIENLLRAHPSVECLSIIGGSLGGLYCRYALKELYEKGLLHGDDNKKSPQKHVVDTSMEDIKTQTPEDSPAKSHIIKKSSLKKEGKSVLLLNYVSLATPHLGIGDWVWNRKGTVTFWRWVKKWMHEKLGIVTQTLAQLSGVDSKRVLLQMTTRSEFIAPLALCCNVLAYCNAANDDLVSFSSSSVLKRMKADGTFVGPSKLCKKRNYLRRVSDAIGDAAFGKLSSSDLFSMDEGSDNSEEHKDEDVKTDDVTPLPLSEMHMKIKWQRYAFFANHGWIKHVAHEFLCSPVDWFHDGRIIIGHLFDHFEWLPPDSD